MVVDAVPTQEDAYFSAYQLNRCFSTTCLSPYTPVSVLFVLFERTGATWHIAAFGAFQPTGTD